MSDQSGKIMLVDDDPVVRVIVEEYLSASGYSVRTLRSGKEFLEILPLLSRNGNRPDVLILDLIMPEINGFEVLRSIKEAPGMQSMPVIMLSANPDILDLAKEYKVTADAYLEKPFEARQILAAVQSLRHS